MNKVPRTFCITLKETPLRTKGFIDSAKSAGLEFTPFYGVLGNRLGLLPKLPNEIEAPGLNIMLPERAIGCNMSHFILWNHLKYLPDEEFLIFEDDAIIEPDFIEKFQEVYSRLPKDWQMAFVGWIKYGKDNLPIPIDTGLSIRIPSATHAYLVKKTILEELCDSMMPFQSNIDLTIIHRLLPKIHYYVFDPSLVNQRSYLNTKDSIWTSLVYDWTNDLYGCKKDLIKNFSLSNGWYLPESDPKNVWVWSKDSFTIKVPIDIDSITLECSTPIDNNLELSIGDNKLNIPLKIGDNSMTIVTKGVIQLTGNVIEKLIPSKRDVNSTDQRVLGVCLKRISLNMGTTSIPLTISEVGVKSPPPMSFKL